jgi:hypothetical protein
MVRMFSLLAFATGATLALRVVQESIGNNHVIDGAALADFLALELNLSGKVVTVVVAEMVVRRNTETLVTGIEKLCEDGFQLRLARLEIITADERSTAFGEIDHTRDESVLGSPVDERSIL